MEIKQKIFKSFKIVMKLQPQLNGELKVKAEMPYYVVDHREKGSFLASIMGGSSSIFQVMAQNASMPETEEVIEAMSQVLTARIQLELLSNADLVRLAMAGTVLNRMKRGI